MLLKVINTVSSHSELFKNRDFTPQSCAAYFRVFFFFFSSMFVERMEVLENCQKFEVELSTFPYSTNT